MASPSWEVPTPEATRGPVGLWAALGDPCHSHACLCGSRIHCGTAAAKSCQRRQFMEPNA